MMLDVKAYPVAAVEVNLWGTVRKVLYRQGSSDEGTLKQVLHWRHYDLRILRRFGELQEAIERKKTSNLRPLIVDAGANIGATALFLQAIFPTAHCVCIEPVRETFDLLCENIKGIDARKVLGALASKPGELVVYDAGEGAYDAFRTGNAPARAEYAGTPTMADAKVEALSMDEILRDVPEDVFPFILKVDVEGAERDIFSGTCDWVDRFPILIVEPHDAMMPKAGCFKPFLQRIADKARDFLVFGENVISIAHDLG